MVLAGRSTAIFPISEKGCSFVVVIICQDRRRAVLCSFIMVEWPYIGLAASCWFPYLALYENTYSDEQEQKIRLDTTIKGMTYGVKY